MPDDVPRRHRGADPRPPTARASSAAIELVSPGNKDRPEARRAFAAKCAGYLTAGVGLVVVDIVTDRLANLHNELIELMRQGGAVPPAAEADLRRRLPPGAAGGRRPDRRLAGAAGGRRSRCRRCRWR